MSTITPHQVTMEYVRESVAKVFRIDMLREMILDYAIRNNDMGNTLSRKNVKSLRLVGKAWLETTSKLVQKGGHPLFKLVLNQTNPANEINPADVHGQQYLDGFTNHFIPDDNGSTVPNFSLKISQNFFRQENHSSLSNCFAKCGESLLELELLVPLNGGSLPSIFPIGISFPILKKLTVNLTDTQLHLEREEATISHPSNASYLIHWILNVAPSLQEYSLPFNGYHGLIPKGFEFIGFPSMLTKLEITCKVSSVHLQALVSSKLPYLQQLKLLVSEKRYSNGLLFKILDNFRASLTDLKIIGTQFAGGMKPATYIRFPVMEKLERFSTTSIHLELQPEVASLETCLSKLHSLDLCHQTLEMFERWTNSSEFATVTQLKIRLVNDNVRQNNNSSDYVRSLNLETMQKLHLAFGNVRKLDLILSLEQTCGLKYMFMEMGQLKELRLVAVGLPSEIHSDFWDGLLIGASVEDVAGIRTRPRPHREIQEIGNEGVPSIKMLTELVTLSLEAKRYAPRHRTKPLISDLAFQFAFLKMPRLKHLKFQGSFKASPKMANLWRNQGNKLDYKL